ncbi:MAG TPA: DUF4982 domain-containing protein [Chitinophagaceae bacterium]|jgi:hypothetical protein
MQYRVSLFFIIAVSFALSVHAQRIKYNFNSDWKVFVGDAPGADKPGFNDEGWKPVTLPYAWNENDAFKKDIAELSTGIAWYRKHFKVPATARGQKLFLEFEGIRQAGQFYLNGVPIGISENGVMAFGFDISDRVHTGDTDNVLSARIDNSWDYKEKATDTKFEWEDRNFYANYGGINKNVYLHVTGRLYQTLPLYSNLGTTGVYIYAKDINVAAKTAEVTVTSQVRNEYPVPKTFSYTVVINEINGDMLQTMQDRSVTLQPGETKEITVSAPVHGLNFWSWGYGYLYDVQTVLGVDGVVADVVTTRTGFRKTAFKNGMVYLNDRVIQVHGYGQRTTNEWPAIGLSVPAWLSDYSNRLIVQGNGNLVRWMHVTPWKQDVESCDRVGLMQSMPAGDAEKDVDGIRWEQRKAVMRDAIIYNRNNPSILFYECGNNVISEPHIADMKAIRDAYDPNGGRAIGSRQMLDSKIAEYGGEMLYINKSAHFPLWAMEYSRDEGLRKYWDEYTPPYHKDGDGPLYRGEPAPEYNHNQDSQAKEDVARWYDYWHERPGTGTRVSSGGVNIIFSESNTHHRGSENYRTSGEVDAMRIPKDSYFANQVMWDGWVDVEKPRIYIIGHWNYEGNLSKDVYVVSSADKVELKINGVSAGFGVQSNRFLYTFKNIRYRPGTIAAIGYDAAGNKIVETQKITAAAPVSVRLKNIENPQGLKADGHDLALVEVEVIDAAGNRCPTALNMIHFDLGGPAEWRGGIAQGPGNYILSKDLPVEGGVNRILIRTTTTAGAITVRASAGGLRPGSLVISSQPVKVVNGLSKEMPATGLQPNLERGPTPATPSFRVTRVAIPIVQAIAGANAADAYKSYDDNELSDWVNDGKLSTAWIEYELEREATVSEVVLKLNNFRTRSYPIRISLDGKIIFSGSTTRNLGYFTAPCTPTKGKKLKIELLPGSSAAAGNTGTEVSGKKLDDGVARDDINAAGKFSIIEAEVYEQVKK